VVVRAGSAGVHNFGLVEVEGAPLITAQPRQRG